MKRLSIIAFIAILLSLSVGCTSSQKSTTGMVGGAVAGGLIGSAVTGGSTVGTVIGAGGGAYLGHTIGKNM